MPGRKTYEFQRLMMEFMKEMDIPLEINGKTNMKAVAAVVNLSAKVSMLYNQSQGKYNIYIANFKPYTP